jgi:Arc/MetJ-type ribon-helix-helix transcriptional regulator
MMVGQRLADARAWELGERTQVDMHTTLGRSGLETLDTLIMAGIAATRADAIRWALTRIRERPAYERLHERIQEIEQLKNEF